MTLRRLRVLAALAGVVCVSLVSTSSAGAWFHSTTGKATSTTITGGVSTITLLPGGFKVICNIVNYQESTIEELVKKLGKQPATLFGPHIQLTVGSWAKCKLEPGKVESEAKIVGLSYQYEQPTKFLKEGTGTFSVVSEGIIEAMGCVVKVPAIEANEFLGKAAFKDSGTKTVDFIPSVSGITVVATGAACEAVGIKSNKEASFTSEVLAVEGVTLE